MTQSRGTETTGAPLVTAGRGCDNVVEVPEAQPRRNEVGRLPCLDILPPSEWTYTSGPPPSARSARRRARRDEEVPRQPLGRGRRVDVGLPRPVARRLRERLPRLRPAEGALRARRRLRRRGRLQGPEVGGRPRPRTTATTRPGWPRRYCRTTSPRYGCRPPRSRGSGTSPGPTTRRPRGSRRRSSGSWRSWPAGGYAYGGTTPAGKPPEVLDVRLPQVARQGPARRRRRHPGACGAEGARSRRPPRRATTSSPSTGPPSRRAPSRRRSRRSSRSRGAGSCSPPPSRPRSATSRGSAPAGR